MCLYIFHNVSLFIYFSLLLQKQASIVSSTEITCLSFIFCISNSTYSLFLSFSVFINTDTQRERRAKGQCLHLTTIFLAAICVHSRTKIHIFGRVYVCWGECWDLSVWPSKSVLTAFSLPPPTMHGTHLLRKKYHRLNLHCDTKALKTTHTSKAKYNFMLYEHQRVETLWDKVSVGSVDRCQSYSARTVHCHIII